MNSFSDEVQMHDSIDWPNGFMDLLFPFERSDLLINDMRTRPKAKVG